MYTLLVSVLTVLILIFLPPTNQELTYWLVLVGIHFSIYKYDIYDGVSLTLP